MNNKDNEVIKSFDDIAKYESENRWNHNNHYYKKLLFNLKKKNSHILDIGCGRGDFVFLAAKYGCTAVGIDFSENMISKARNTIRTAKNGEKCTFTHGDAYEKLTSFKDASFDAVFSVAAMHHMDYAKILPLIRNIVKPDGFFGVVDLYKSSSPADYLINGLAVPVNILSELLRNFGKSKSEEEKKAWHDHCILDEYKTISEIKSELDMLGFRYRIQRLLYFRYMAIIQFHG